MKQKLFEQKREITIPAADLERANLMGVDRLELHLLDQAAVVIPGEMTARELIEVGESLLKLTFSLVVCCWSRVLTATTAASRNPVRW